MQIQFANPVVLLALAPLLVHVLWMARRLHHFSRARRVTAISIRLLIILLLVASLAGMRIVRESKDLTVFFVIDASDSLPEKQREYARTFVQKALAEMGPNDRAGTILFGSGAALHQAPAFKPEYDQAQTVIDPSRSNIADAVQLAMVCFLGDVQKRIVLLSDGNQNVGNAEQAARSAAAAGIVIDVVPLEYENRNDVILEKVVVENRVSLEEPFDLSIFVSARVATVATLTVLQDGNVIGHTEVELEADRKNVFVYPTEVRDAGFTQFEVRLDVENDLIPENNRGFAFTYGEGEPRVLLVDGDAEPSQALPAMLVSEKINVDVVDPSGLPHTLRELQNYDALIFNNVAAGDVTIVQMRTIERAVHDLGLGFIMIGGENSFGAGGYNDSPIERILPVDMELKNEKIVPQGALVIVNHALEIPQGAYWAEQVTYAALDVLSPRDLMGVLYYSWQDQESWLFPVQEVGTKTRLRSLIQTMQTGDMPSFDNTLQMAYTALTNSTAAVRHIVIISDGDPATPNPTLIANIQQAKITISTIVINPHNQRGRDVMRNLANLGGGNFYDVTAYNTLPQIFIKEATTVRKSLIWENPFVPVTQQYSPLLIGFGEDYPELKGYVGTSPKDLADVPLVTDKSDPLLAHWRHGLGKTVAFTSDAKERWANDWLSWDQYSKFWSQLVRWTLRSPFNPNFQVQISVDGARGTVVIDAVDRTGEFLNFLDLSGSIVTPSLEADEVDFRQTAPGRYEAHFDASEPGTYMLGAQALSESGDTADMLTGGATLSYSPEYQNSSSNKSLLSRLADITRGRTLDATSPVFLHNLPSQTQPIPLWPNFMLAALLLFLADVFARRVLVGWDELSAGTRVVWNWLQRKMVRTLATPEGATDQLLRVKESVRPKQGPGDAGREEFLASLKEVKIDRSPMFQQDAISEARKRFREQEEPGAGAAIPQIGEGATFTGQLLQARQKAQARMRKPQRKEDES